MISPIKYHQLKSAIKHQIFGNDSNIYLAYSAEECAKYQELNVAKSIIFARSIRASDALQG